MKKKNQYENHDLLKLLFGRTNFPFIYKICLQYVQYSTSNESSDISTLTADSV